MTPVSAPAAPGQLGVAVQPQATLAYLGALDGWLGARRGELAALDAEILANPAHAGLTADMALSLALWQAAKNRYDLLLVTWDSGRVGPAEAERLSSLIWGRLDTASAGGQPTPLAGMAVSLPEACRLSDALVAQLRTRLNLDPAAERQGARVRDLRASLERIRDQLRQQPPPDLAAATGEVASLAARLDDVVGKRERGGDVGGLLGPLEIDVARYERNLIVEGAQRRENRDALARARDQVSELTAREAALHQLVDRAIRTVSPVPKYAVPDVAALGPLPNTRAGIDAYAARLTQVGRAMQHVQDAYGQALFEHDQAAGELRDLTARAGAGGQAADPQLAGLLAVLDALVGRRPAPMPVIRPLLETVRAQLAWLSDAEGSQR